MVDGLHPEEVKWVHPSVICYSTLIPESTCLSITDAAVIYSGILYTPKKEGSRVIWDIIVESGAYSAMGNQSGTEN